MREIIELIRDAELPIDVLFSMPKAFKEAGLKYAPANPGCHVYVSLRRPIVMSRFGDMVQVLALPNNRSIVLSPEPLKWDAIINHELTPEHWTRARLALELEDRMEHPLEMQQPASGGMRAALLTSTGSHRVTLFEHGVGPVGHITDENQVALVRIMLSSGYTEWSPGTCDNIMECLAAEKT